jgi:hypothetical protein
MPDDALYYEDETPYLGKNFDVYLYYFTRWTNLDNYLRNDTFSPVLWFVWNTMTTYWMPYIQFFDADTWKELFVHSKNPMVLRTQVYHMKELYEWTDGLFEPLTKEEVINMYNLSQISDEKYPITYNWLEQNNMLKWPSMWVLDRSTWNWLSAPFKLLNTDWLVETTTYHIQDEKIR